MRKNEPNLNRGKDCFLLTLVRFEFEMLLGLVLLFKRAFKFGFLFDRLIAFGVKRNFDLRVIRSTPFFAVHNLFIFFL